METRCYFIFGDDKSQQIKDIIDALPVPAPFFACSTYQKRAVPFDIPMNNQSSESIWAFRNVIVMEAIFDTESSELYTQACENSEWHWGEPLALRVSAETMPAIPDDAIRLYWYLGLPDADTDGKTSEQIEEMYQNR